jgi:hypothetical protein
MWKKVRERLVLKIAGLLINFAILIKSKVNRLHCKGVTYDVDLVVGAHII